MGIPFVRFLNQVHVPFGVIFAEIIQKLITIRQLLRLKYFLGRMLRFLKLTQLLKHKVKQNLAVVLSCLSELLALRLTQELLELVRVLVLHMGLVLMVMILADQVLQF